MKTNKASALARKHLNLPPVCHVSRHVAYLMPRKLVKSGKKTDSRRQEQTHLFFKPYFNPCVEKLDIRIFIAQASSVRSFPSRDGWLLHDSNYYKPFVRTDPQNSIQTDM